jgi:hypothetical protein
MIKILSLQFKDPFLLTNWIVDLFKKIKFTKYRLFMKYFFYLINFFFINIFKDLNIKGLKVKIKGKVGVSGNARTRSFFFSVGISSNSTFNTKVAYDLNYIKTFTGILSFQFFIYF